MMIQALAAMATLLGPTFSAVGQESAESLDGCWRSLSNPEHFIRFDAKRFLDLQGSDLRAGIILDRADRAISLRMGGQVHRWTFERDRSRLKVIVGSLEEKFERVERAPKELTVEPLKLAEAKDLPPARIKALQEEIARLLDNDQKPRRAFAEKNQPELIAFLKTLEAKGPKYVPTKAEHDKIQELMTRTQPLDESALKLLEDMDRVDRETDARLVALVQEVGWVDVRRFGKETADAVLLFLSHSHNIPLRSSGLAFMEQEVEKKMRKAADLQEAKERLQLDLGEPSRFDRAK